MTFLLDLIDIVYTLLWLVVLAHVIVSWVLSPWHDVRRFLDSLVDPLLAPLRRIIPPAGGLDLSPLVLIIALFLIRSLLVSIVRAFA